MQERHASSAASTERRASVLLPLPLAGAYDYSVPHGLNVELGDFVAVPLGKRRLVGVVWGEGSGDVADAKLKPIEDILPAPPLARRAAPLRRLGGELHALGAGRGTAHGDERARRARAAARADGLCAERGRTRDPCGKRCGAHQAAAARARSGGGKRRRDGKRSRRARGVQRRRGEGAGRRRPVAQRRSAAPRHAAAARFPLRGSGALARARRRGARARRACRARRVFGDAARRRHRLGQDRSLFRGDRRVSRARPPGAGAAARDRALGAIPRALRIAVRRAAGALAFGAAPRATPRHVARGRRRQGAGRGRRALGAVPALSRSRPHRHR